MLHQIRVELLCHTNPAVSSNHSMFILRDLRWLADALPLDDERINIRMVYMVVKLSLVEHLQLELLLMG